MHNMHNATGRSSATESASTAPHPAPVVRRAAEGDVDQLVHLVNGFAADGSLLPRSRAYIASALDQYVVATDEMGRVMACAALHEYSPSLAEVSSVAVSPAAQGRGLGRLVVLAVERLARQRDFREVFAITLADGFFRSLDYSPTMVTRYPEKLARYAALEEQGFVVQPKRCYRKRLQAARAA